MKLYKPYDSTKMSASSPNMLVDKLCFHNNPLVQSQTEYKSDQRYF